MGFYILNCGHPLVFEHLKYEAQCVQPHWTARIEFNENVWISEGQLAWHGEVFSVLEHLFWHSKWHVIEKKCPKLSCQMGHHRTIWDHMGPCCVAPVVAVLQAVCPQLSQPETAESGLQSMGEVVSHKAMHINAYFSMLFHTFPFWDWGVDGPLDHA